MVFKQLLLFISVMTFSCLSCVSTSSQTRAVGGQYDASVMPYRSFVFITAATLFRNKECAPNKRDSLGQCPLNNQTSTASGVFILRSSQTSSIAYALTAKHVCDQEGAIKDDENNIVIGRVFTATDYQGNKHRALKLFTSNDFDACIMIVKNVSSNVVMAAVAQKMVRQGERVYNLSAPRGIWAPKMVLTFDGFYSGEIDDRLIFTIPIAPGSSGSPIFNSEGQIVSMLWAMPIEEYNDGNRVIQRQVIEQLGFGIRLDAIKNMLASVMAYDSVAGLGSPFK